ncbi:MAG TPA: hypothetical protein VGS21_01435 [Acidimicrobiales bacterium]|nr:hypothetical protein [Acidimicrobiales bacterium]
MLSKEQAAELRAQITSHLDDALADDSSDIDVRIALKDLGTPRQVVAEALKANPVPVGIRALRRLKRVRWWVWVILVVIVGVAGTGIYLVTSYVGAPPLTLGSGIATWWSPYDAAHQVSSTANDQQQTTVDVRQGATHGFVVTVWNPSDVTQTVLGAAPDQVAMVGGPLDVTVSTTCATLCDYDFRSLRYATDVSIPPGGYRLLRLLWTSNACNVAPDSSMDQTSVDLEVSVGGFIRTETIDFQQGFALAGTTASYKGCTSSST